MSDQPLRGVVVSHGVLGTAMVDAVGKITGDPDALVAVSNEGCSGASLRELVAKAVGETPCLVFVDLHAGSCLQAAVATGRGRDGMAVVAGVNLAMLIDFVHHRDVSAEAAAARAVEVGGRSIRVVSPS